MPGQPSEASEAPTDLHAFAVRLRRMNGEINRLVHGFAGDQGLHATDVQALAAILDADEPMTPKRPHWCATSTPAPGGRDGSAAAVTRRMTTRRDDSEGCGAVGAGVYSRVFW